MEAYTFYNPVGGKLGKDEHEKLASIYSAGIGFEPSEKFFISVEIQKEEDKPVNVNAGLQYQFLPQLLARAGVSAATSSLYMGIGFRLKSLRLTRPRIIILNLALHLACC